MSRDKGARGERDVVNTARRHGLRADRTAQLQANAVREVGEPDVKLHDFPGLHVEVKHDERMSVDAMVRQATEDAGAKSPIVVWRRNRKPWRADVPLDLLLDLLAMARAT